MKCLLVSLASTVALASLVVAGCAQATPAPTAAPTAAPPKAAPTTAPAAPTKAPEPTKPAVQPTAAPAQPTAAPAKKVDFPAKGRSITFIVPWPAGGGTDIASRVLASFLEKELGVPVQVVNKGGASGQIGATDLVMARPDGYTIALTSLPSVIFLYLDPERKAAFTRKDFRVVASYSADPYMFGVKADSPYKTMKDLLDAAKASPEKIKYGAYGVGNEVHLAALQLEQLAGVRFAIPQFEGGAAALTAMMGGHVDFTAGTASTWVPVLKNGQTRVLGVMDKEGDPRVPGVPTTVAQGYPVYARLDRTVSAPPGTPDEIVDALSAAIKRSMDNEEHKKKAEESGYSLRYMDAKQAGARWDEIEAQVRPLWGLIRQ